MSEILNIEDKLKSIEVIITKRKNPIVPVMILLLSVACGVYSMAAHNGENMGFGLLFIAIILAIIGLKGLVLPKKILKYMPTNEIITKKEFYYATGERKEVEDCLKAKGFEMLKCLPQGASSSLRVVLYTTGSGSYSIAQLQQYVPHEYIPVYDAE